MSDVTFDGYVLAAVLTIVSIGSIYLAGRIAERRGRSFKNWAWIAGILIGPLARPRRFLFPTWQGKDGNLPCAGGGVAGRAGPPLQGVVLGIWCPGQAVHPN